MALIVESLIVELGLDASKFTLQQREAFEAAKRLEAQQEKAAKNIEHGAGKAATAINGIRNQAIAMFAAFTGGQGLVQFGLQLTHANAQLGRLERNIGVSASQINQWQGAARLFGGSAEQMAQSYTTLSDAFAGIKIGEMTPLIAELRRLGAAGGHVIETFDSIDTMYRKMSANFKNIHDKDPATAGLLGRRMGIDPAFYDLLIQGPEKLEKVLEYVRKIGVATTADTDAFGELEKRISQMGLKAESLGRKILGGEGGGASTIIRFADWLNKSPGDAWADFKEWISNGQARAGSDQASTASAPRAQKIAGGSVGGAFSSQAEKEAFIRAEAAKRGINPNVAMEVARREGFNNFTSTIPGETSYGAYQLHVTPGGRGGHLGDQFRAQTGLDPSNPENERRGIQFALDDVKKNGWKAFHGARNNNISQWQGVDRSAGSTSTTEVNIQQVTVVAPATSDANAWAKSFESAVKNRAFAANANVGQN